jgi:hypothetical protein
MVTDTGSLNPEQMLQQQQILRQQKMAEMLMQQGMQQPQGQMISGRYVAPSIFQNLAGLANQYIGQRGIEKAQQAQIDLAKQLRADESSAMADFMQQRQGRPAEMFAAQAGPMPDGGNIPLQESRAAIAPNPQGAYANLMANPKASPRLQNLAFNKLIADPEAFTLTEGGVRFEKMPDGTVRQIAAGPAKVRAPIQVDTGTHIEFRDAVDPTKLLQRIPKSQMPTAGQVVETANGPMIVNTRTGDAQPIMAGGQPLAPKLTSEQSKDITAVNQQRATIEGAIADVKANKSAFSFGRGLAQNVPYGESLAGRLETPAETETRAYVFNNVSSVIKERAGAAQSAQELQRLNAFLPATTDSADQIVSKLNGFKKYLNDYEKGTRVPTSKQPDALQSNSFASEADAQKAFSSGKLKAGDKITINGVTGTWK